MSGRASRLLPMVGLAAAAALIVTLGAQKRGLRAELEQSQLQLERPYVGLVVPSFSASTLSGDSITVAPGAPDRLQVLFVFDTACGYCKRTIPVWNDIAAQLKNLDHLQVIGLSLSPESPTRSYVEQFKVEFPVVVFPGERLKKLYRANVIPITAFVDSHGLVAYVRLGALDRSPEAVDSILRFGRSSFLSGGVREFFSIRRLQ